MERLGEVARGRVTQASYAMEELGLGDDREPDEGL